MIAIALFFMVVALYYTHRHVVTVLEEVEIHREILANLNRIALAELIKDGGGDEEIDNIFNGPDIGSGLL